MTWTLEACIYAVFRYLDFVPVLFWFYNRQIYRILLYGTVFIQGINQEETGRKTSKADTGRQDICLGMTDV